MQPSRRNSQRRAKRSPRASSYGPFTPAIDPPSITTTPWNNLVVASVLTEAEAGVFSVSSSSLATGIRGQLGFDPGTVINMRILSVSVWSTPADLISAAPLNFAIRTHNLLTAGANEWQEDGGTVAQPAKLGYRYSPSQAEVVLTSSQSVPLMEVDVGSAFNLFIHVRVMWKGGLGDPIPTFRRPSSVGLFERAPRRP